jgi:hypothetical protein
MIAKRPERRLVDVLSMKGIDDAEAVHMVSRCIRGRIAHRWLR